MSRKTISIIVLCLISISILGQGVAWSKYPEKKIRVVCPHAAGGGTDLMARSLARYANPFLDGKLYVENVTGGGGIIGAVEGLRGAPDGYTLIMLATTNAVAPHTVKGHPPVEDFDPLCIAVIDPMILAVGVDSPFKTAKELIAYAKANPGKLSGGTSGAGGPNHLVLAAFATAIGSDFSYVPFKGSSPALLAAAGKHVDMSSAGGSEGLTLSQGKKIRVLISFSDKRSPLYPDAPTAKELGYDVEVSRFNGIGTANGVPKDVRKMLSDAFKKAMANKEFIKLIEDTGQIPVLVSDDEARTWIRKQSLFYRGVAEKAGIKPE
jgi:tripartite-type tricarboxylate transporter receptor subunit TctC